MRRTIVKTVFAAVGLFLLASAVVAVCLGTRGWGLYVAFGFSALLLVGGLVPDTMLRRLPSWIRLTVCGLTAVFLGLYIFLFLFGRTDTVTYTEDAVVVLGCGLRGDKPSKSLKARLDRAVAYHAHNPNALIVVSGGKGDDEDVSEAQAMETYLLENGVDAAHILKEDASTSTVENFTFTKALLDARLDSEYRIAYISNSYHIYRAGLIAADAGFHDATHAFAPTPWPSVTVGGLRECVAVVAQWIAFIR